MGRKVRFCSRCGQPFVPIRIDSTLMVCPSCLKRHKNSSANKRDRFEENNQKQTKNCNNLINLQSTANHPQYNQKELLRKNEV